MTREEEIKTQARLYSPNDIGIQGAFEVSARWADRTMIEKACKWLKDYAHMYVSETTGDLNEGDLINDFRKDMKGE